LKNRVDQKSKFVVGHVLVTLVTADIWRVYQ
jgi:hypothetical protein